MNRTARWDPDAMRDDQFTDDNLCLGGPNGILIIDENGFCRRAASQPEAHAKCSNASGPASHPAVSRTPKTWSGAGARLRRRTG